MSNEFKEIFDNKKVDVDGLLKKIIVNDELGYIVANVENGLSDVISNYCVKEYEILNPYFKETVNRFASQIPDDKPLVLELTGYKFSEEEKARIQNAVWHDYEFDYTVENNEYKKYIQKTLFHFVLSVLFLAYLYTGTHSEMWMQIFWIPLWVFLDTVFALFLSVIPTVKKNKRRLVQRQTMKLVFTEKFIDVLTDEDIKILKQGVKDNAKINIL